MEKDNIMASLKVAERLKESLLKEADQLQRQPQNTTAPQPANSAVDQTQLEKAFEAALQTVKGEIVKEIQGLMEKFGETLVKKLQEDGSGSGPADGQQQLSSSKQNNSGNTQEENIDGNK